MTGRRHVPNVRKFQRSAPHVPPRPPGPCERLPQATDRDSRRERQTRPAVALAIAEHRHVDGHAQRRVAGRPRASDELADQATVLERVHLEAALTAAGLVETLKGKGPFTVFAPTDAAFAKLPAGTVENLLKPENKAQLTNILTYHVVAGSVKAADVVKLTEAKTVQGQSVKITVKDGKVSVDGATVTATDIAASNGVIHVIDSVMMPK